MTGDPVQEELHTSVRVWRYSNHLFHPIRTRYEPSFLKSFRQLLSAGEMEPAQTGHDQQFQDRNVRGDNDGDEGVAELAPRALSQTAFPLTPAKKRGGWKG